MKLIVEGMSCGHCAGRVTQAVTALDANAKVEIDLATKNVSVQLPANSATLEQAVADAISAAGYPASLASV